MTIERLFDRGMLTKRSTLFVFDEGRLLYEGDIEGAPLHLVIREIAELSIQYKERRPASVNIRLVHDGEKKLTVRRLYQTVLHPHTHITLVNQGVTVYVGYYYDLPRCYLASTVKNYRWVVGEFNEIIIEI